jgi:hypothetical protein
MTIHCPSSELPNLLHRGSDNKYPDIIALWISGEKEETRSIPTISQCGSHHHFSILKRDLKLSSKRVFSVDILLALPVPRITHKVSDKENSLQIL